MKALVYHGPGERSWSDVPEPHVKDPDDAIVRIDATTICGTDLHILHGDVPEVAPGRILGHEGVGTVLETGPGVRSIKVGDRVLISCISPCGQCRYCRDGQYGQCLTGGWMLGHTIDGTQAEQVRVPFADRSLHVLPAHVADEAALVLSDILPTAYEVGVIKGAVCPGDVVVIVGAGPIGLAAVLTSRLFSPGRVVVIDPAESRRNQALAMGADAAYADPGALRDDLDSWTDALGADVAIEAVGVPAAFEACVDLVRPGGHVANVGVHGAPAILHLERIWIRNLTITTGLVDTRTTPLLLRLIGEGIVDPSPLITHRFRLDEMDTAYGVFARASETGALKVAITRQGTVQP
jgi:alcohol dehydrogenase